MPASYHAMLLKYALDFVGLDGLFKKRDGAQLFDAFLGLGLNVGGYDDDKGLEPFALELFEDLIPIHYRHGEIEKHLVRLALAVVLYRFLAIAGLRDFHLPPSREGFDHQFPRHAGVVDDEYRSCHPV